MRFTCGVAARVMGLGTDSGAVPASHGFPVRGAFRLIDGEFLCGGFVEIHTPTGCFVHRGVAVLDRWAAREDFLSGLIEG